MSAGTDDATAFAGVAEQARLLRARAVSSRELALLYLRRIDRLDPRLNAYRVVLGDQALAQADEADRRIAAGEEGPLLGVPLALKDTHDLAGESTCLGSAAFGDPAAEDSVLVGRLRAAGAVFLGKTNLPELAIFGFTESDAFGITRNPWRLDRTPGGSSGGSAVAVAAGLAAGATASDGAGSIRIPAANCGLFGLKPQHGRVPFEPADHWCGLSVNGCLTRTVADTALYLDVATAGGGDPGGPPSPARPFAEAARTAPGRLRIAVSAKPLRALAPPIVSPEARRALDEAEALLRSLGHAVERRDPSFGLTASHLTARYLGGIRREAGAVAQPERLEPRTRGFARLGALYEGRLARRAVARADADAERIHASLGRPDVLVTPTVGEPPVAVGRWAGKGAFRTLMGMSRSYCFTPAWNQTGQPAAAVPMGVTGDGLPLSVQLVGRPADEATLLSLAAQIEAERPWAARRPEP